MSIDTHAALLTAAQAMIGVGFILVGCSVYEVQYTRKTKQDWQCFWVCLFGMVTGWTGIAIRKCPDCKSSNS